jgi:hypothetical protein
VRIGLLAGSVPSLGEHGQCLLQIAREDLPPEQRHHGVEQPSLALPAPVKNDPDVAARAVAGFGDQCPRATGLEDVRVLRRTDGAVA